MSNVRAPLPAFVYSTRQVREFDRCAIEEHGIEGFELMQRAARAALEFLRARWPQVRSLAICCGAGNNAGDGYVLASLAVAEGITVQVRAVVDPDALAGDAARAVAMARAAGVPIGNFDADASIAATGSELIVDALLGTGLTRDVDGPMAAAVAAIQAAALPVLALDVPTGLDSDSGAIRGSAVAADATISFVGLKAGCFLGAGPDMTGTLAFSDLDIPAAVFEGVVPRLRRLAPGRTDRLLGRRSRSSHKSLNGRVLVVGGAPGMAGAARLAAEAALRSGAGLVHAAVAPESAAQMLAGRPEIMCRGIGGAKDIADWIDAADVLVVGPGLGRSVWSERLAAALLAVDKPLVLDADGLNYLAAHRQQRANWVLTPHPGEAGRLLERSGAAVQAARLDAVAALARDYAAIAVLKGACSLVAQITGKDSDPVAVCDYGNPGMATAGMGDVLSGVLGGLIAQFGLSREVVECGVLVHALAGDDAAAAGERGLLASDLFGPVRRRVNPD
jgi:NAD(P)H-hydrate epimerase